MQEILEIGPGKHPIPNADTLDCVKNPTYKVKWGYDTFPIPEQSYYEVFASHVLEHVPWFKAISALKEVARILKPGGLFEVWVPDFRVMVQAYLDKECGDAWRVHNTNNDFMKWVNGRLFTYGPGEENFHKTAYDEDFLHQCLIGSGFIDIQRKRARTRGISHGIIDLGVIARIPIV